MPLTPLTLIIPTLPIPQGSPGSTQCGAVGIWICSHQLMEEASSMLISLGSDLWTPQNINRNHLIDFVFFFMFYPRPLSSLAYSPWSSRHCQTWGPSRGSVLKLDQSLVVHLHKLWATIASAHLASNTWVGLRLCGWVGVLVPPLGVLPCYQRWSVKAHMYNFDWDLFF